MPTKKKFATYSLPDIRFVMNHPGYGKCILSDCGSGRLTVSNTGDLASMTATATGYMVINKMAPKGGQMSVEIPVNSPADKYLQALIAYLQNAPTSEFGLGTATLLDPAGGMQYEYSGVVPQKKPDKAYDEQSGNRQYTFLFAQEVEMVCSNQPV